MKNANRSNRKLEAITYRTTCAKVCPADNIRVTDKVEYLHHCECCLGCMHNCPKKAIHLKNEKSSVRFRNSEVTIKKLINANN